MIIDNDCHTCGSICFTSVIGLDAVQPGRTRSNVVDRREIDVFTAGTVSVQRVKVVECQRVLVAFNDCEIYFWFRVDQLRSNVGGKIVLARVKPNDRRCRV